MMHATRGHSLTPEQRESLEEMFQKSKYLGGSARSELAERIHLSEESVKIWFQSRREKWKLEVWSGVSAEECNALNEDEIEVCQLITYLHRNKPTSTSQESIHEWELVESGDC